MSALVTRPLTRQRGAVRAGDDGAGGGGCCALAAAPKTAPINRANIVCGGRDLGGHGIASLEGEMKIDRLIARHRPENDVTSGANKAG